MEEVDKQSDKTETDKCEKEEKALFIQRLLAYIVDFFIVILVVSIVSTPFVNQKELKELNEKSQLLLSDYTSEKISNEEFVFKYMDISYKIARSEGIVSFMTIIAYILYFVVFQIYNKGQTIGKKFMKIKIVSDEGDLTMNQMIFRSFISNAILLNVITFILMMFLGKSDYFYSVETLSVVQYVITIISVFMILYGKNGTALHDKWFHTRVIRDL